MAAMAPKKGDVHPWWAVAASLLAVLDSGNAEVIALAEAEYKKARRIK